MAGTLSTGVRPAFVSGHDLIDVAEGQFERQWVDPQRAQGLPPPAEAAAGELETLKMPAELGDLIGLLSGWQQTRQEDALPASHDVADAVLGGRFAQAAYRMQLLPLLGDEQARDMQGQTGDLARLPWRAALLPEVQSVDDEQVAAISAGQLHPENRILESD